MTCEWIKTADGPMIICGRGPRARKCSACGRTGTATKECDYPARTRSGTCDKALCDRCAVSVGDNLDHCPDHPKLVAAAVQGELGL